MQKKSKTFYEHFGFIKLNDNELNYFMLVDSGKRDTIPDISDLVEAVQPAAGAVNRLFA